MNRMEKIRRRVAEGDAWWHNYCVTMNKFNEGKVAIGCALNPDKPLTSERRYVD
tara:strand:- start:288 stop:449 length:162 start_codon:yes stop_codon:yes gene_type:complete